MQTHKTPENAFLELPDEFDDEDEKPNVLPATKNMSTTGAKFINWKKGLNKDSKK